jgi:hypothetical protein
MHVQTIQFLQGFLMLGITPRCKHILSSIALALSAGLALPAQAGVVGFDGQAQGFLMDGDSIISGGYQFSAAFAGAPGDGGGLVGAVIDGKDAGLCVNLSCPQNNLSMYLGALNDGMLSMQASSGAFRLDAFDASFFGHDLRGEPPIAGVLRLTGLRADGSELDEYYALDPSLYGFQHYLTSDEFAATSFVSILFTGYSCNYKGFCNAFDSNQGQFALDNLSASIDVPGPGNEPGNEVPEPGTALLFALGGALIRTRLRRRPA